MEMEDCTLPQQELGSGSSLAQQIAQQALSSRRELPPDSKETLFRRYVTNLEERELQCRNHSKFDKAFACAWLNSQQIVIGTKCNRLLLINSDEWKCPSLPLVQEIPLPSRPEQNSSQNSNPNPANRVSPVQSALWSVASQSRNARSSQGSESAGSVVEDEGNLVAGMIRSASDGSQNSQANRIRNQQVPNCGMHCISISPCRSLMACGGANPNDCQIFGLLETGNLCELQPLQTLIGHEDWIFGCDWVTNRHVVTGSRDNCLKLWGIGYTSEKINKEPLCTVSERKEKVRDVKYMRNEGRVASLSIDGCVQIWDPHLNLINTVSTPYSGEVVCMAASENLAAIGSRNNVAFVDCRIGKPTNSIANADHNHGIRSLAFSHNLLSIGGGQGRLHFWDLRKGQYINSNSGTESPPPFHLQTGKGFLLENEVYWSHFEGMHVNHACYAHAWNPSEQKLLTVGGPLAYGLTGHYTAIWE